ncbi:cbb3-type cytochrome c oxidase subunit II [Roseibacillus ishigakijimensis]|uniref:Cbb3-type cytochrome c oxidase subunit II n=1 Tax=Roseibacillus ishigakijimensis TaxID=454146 RepID=A0A934RVG2_9BACT|nr:cbb3-type cytochrome c oxidase subunit II [Roseibacillus ishigakijimensis]MBK1834900.1 cbb3-type cytochrome c oxidase subunit II [Roseibacillus ishigakijimensis]
MKFKAFLGGLTVAFGLPWVLAVAIPYGKMANLEPVRFDENVDGFEGVYEFKRSGRTDGAGIYAANGCALCHTQLIRPSFAGTDMYREDWAGIPADPSNGIEDSRRETNPYDFAGEKFAYIGQSRVGPDLSNVAIRAAKRGQAEGITAKQWLLEHLYNPRNYDYQSVCPSVSFLFEGSADKPKSDAKALADYLLSMRKDNVIPKSLNPREY